MLSLNKTSAAKPPWSWGSWMLQSVAVFLLPFVFQLFVPMVLGSEYGGSPLGPAGHQAFNAIAIGLLGFGVAYAVIAARPKAQPAAAAVWIVPAAYLALRFSIAYWAFGWQNVIADFFYIAQPGRDEAGMARDFITYPALSAATYSLGAFVARRIQARQRQ